MGFDGLSQLGLGGFLGKVPELVEGTSVSGFDKLSQLWAQQLGGLLSMQQTGEDGPKVGSGQPGEVGVRAVPFGDDEIGLW